MGTSHSRDSLVEKLGIKQGFKIVILYSPQDYNNTLGKLPENVIVMKELEGSLDFIHFFTKEKQELENKFPILKREISQNGITWVSWPKRSSGIETDLDEGTIRGVV